MAKTRALITGITGMVGSHLADYLLAHTGISMGWPVGAALWTTFLTC